MIESIGSYYLTSQSDSGPKGSLAGDGTTMTYNNNAQMTSKWRRKALRQHYWYIYTTITCIKWRRALTAPMEIRLHYHKVKKGTDSTNAMFTLPQSEEGHWQHQWYVYTTTKWRRALTAQWYVYTTTKWRRALTAPMICLHYHKVKKGTDSTNDMFTLPQSEEGHWQNQGYVYNNTTKWPHFHIVHTPAI